MKSKASYKERVGREFKKPGLLEERGKDEKVAGTVQKKVGQLKKVLKKSKAGSGFRSGAASFAESLFLSATFEAHWAA